MKRTIPFAVLLVSSVIISNGYQQLPSQSGGTATIAGQVTHHGDPVRGALILVRPEPPIGPNKPVSAKTDATGKYRIETLSPGRYTVMAQAPAMTLERATTRRVISLEPGETRDGIDFTLVQGGVITGQVTDENGRPVVEEMISVREAPADGPGRGFVDYEMLPTDDRGMYRVYGLPPGRYMVSVGYGGKSRYRTLNHEQGYYSQTYHPGVQEESKAGIVEVAEGNEVTGIDIVVGKRSKSFQASGRILNAVTGQPQPGIKYGYDGNAMSTFGRLSDEKGAFIITGLMPGRYSVFAGCEGDFYSDKLEFEISDHDITGLEVRRTPGIGIRGNIIVEGASDPSNQITVAARGSATGKAGYINALAGPNNYFHFCGLRPGKLNITAQSRPKPGIQILRIEHKGEDLRKEINVTPGNSLTDVRVIVSYMTGVIRGQVIIEGTELPPGVYLQISARRLENEDQFNHFFANTDDRGRFTIEGLAPGEYELSAGNGWVTHGVTGKPPRLTPVLQKIVVTNGRESTVTLTLRASDNRN